MQWQCFQNKWLIVRVSLLLVRPFYASPRLDVSAFAEVVMACNGLLRIDKRVEGRELAGATGLEPAVP